MDTLGRSLAGLGVAFALLVVGCGTPGDLPWAAEARAWFAGLDATFEEQSLEHAYYYTPDAVNDSTMIQPRHYTEGRWPTVQLQSTSYSYENLFGPLYLSAGAAVRSHLMLLDPGGRFQTVVVLMSHFLIGEDGIERHTHLAHTELDYAIRDRQDEAVALAEQVAADYLQVWSGGTDLVGQLYAHDAGLADDMRRLSANGREAIGALAAASAPIVAQTNAEILPQRALDMAPEVAVDVPAVFLKFDLDRAHRPTQVWLLVRSQTPCPGDSLVALELDDRQRVTAERRYASIASVRECVESADAPTGWWTGRDLPLPFGERATGTVSTAAGEVEIRNGWPPANAAVAWAFGQFAAAGLPAPVVSWIAFEPFDELCRDFPGYAEWDDDTTEILICFDSARIGEPPGQDPAGPDVEAPTDPAAGDPATGDPAIGDPAIGDPATGDPAAGDDASTGYLPQRGNLLLHELGHAWLVTHTGEEVREAFMASVGTEEWNDKAEPWAERGVEWAAETLAWGLRGIPGTAYPLGAPDCAVLADGFRLLTGTDPLTPCYDDTEW